MYEGFSYSQGSDQNNLASFLSIHNPNASALKVYVLHFEQVIPYRGISSFVIYRKARWIYCTMVLCIVVLVILGRIHQPGWSGGRYSLTPYA